MSDSSKLTDRRVSLEWRIKVATAAIVFFNLRGHTEALAAIGKEDPPGAALPMSGFDFMKFLPQQGVANPWPLAFHVQRVLDALVDVGLLRKLAIVSGGPFLAHSYWYMEGITRAQASGHLWLAEAFGASLLVPSFGSATLALTGKDKTTGDGRVGSGLIVDQRHVLTCAHVVNGMVLDEEIQPPDVTPPASAGAPSEAVPVGDIFCDESRDVALIETDGRLFTLRGVALRDPVWSDRASIFGFPRVPRSIANDLIVQTGEIVNPSVKTFDDRDVFLFSATARPGNSGGPVVGGDGRVLGLVAEQLAAEMVEENSAPFYLGIPASTILEALSGLGKRGLVTAESWG